MDAAIVPATASDAIAIAALHAQSWQSAYRGLVPDSYLDGPVVEERRRFWRARLADDSPDRLTLKAVHAGHLVGFACVLRDEDPAWGPLLDNLHVRPDLKGLGLGSRLLQACREWAAAVAPSSPMHLWVIEGNLPARRFYDRRGGTLTERRIVNVPPGVPVAALRYVWPALSTEGT